MLNHRVIPVLQIFDERLVKSFQFTKPVHLGDPINAVKIFNEKQVDELVLLDIGATDQKKAPAFDLIEKIAGEAFMPVSYGGGVASVEIARQLFRLGIEKVVIRSTALENPQFLRVLSDEFGSSSVVASVDVKKNRRGLYQIYCGNKRISKTKRWPEVVDEFKTQGAGEILLQSVDRDGTMLGPDLELLQSIGTISIPLVFAGGVSSIEDMRDILNAGADAVAAGAFFVLHGPHRALLITYPEYSVLEQELGGI
jgi:cyclase